MEQTAQKILDNSYHYASEYTNTNSNVNRKRCGQFFTPVSIATHMASLVDINKEQLKILDPGAGTGVLLAALCNRIANEIQDPISITIDAWEIDEKLTPYLKSTTHDFETKLIQLGHDATITVRNMDFILNNSHYVQSDALWPLEEHDRYSIVIANPPYYKLKATSRYSRLLETFVEGQPNIYSLFMVLSASMLKNGGEFVFITPRSFCSGLYYKKVREWFIHNSSLKAIHIFKSRTKVFSDDKVEQEVIIFNGTKNNSQGKILVTSSLDSRFSDIKTLYAQPKDVIVTQNAHSYIRIPNSPDDLNILEVVDSWENDLKDFGMGVSTGKVVDFRVAEYLVDNSSSKEWVPLLWMKHCGLTGVSWPIENYRKRQAILKIIRTESLLVPNNDYILIKRFSSKCQSKRITASPLFKENFSEYTHLGFENHLNYIYGIEGDIETNIILGITALLNSSVIDRYYRMISGNTQVNVTDIRKLPLPNLDLIEQIGDFAIQNGTWYGDVLDQKISLFGKYLYRTLITRNS